MSINNYLRNPEFESDFAGYLGMRPASPMVRRKRDFFEWEFTKKMNAVGL